MEGGGGGGGDQEQDAESILRENGCLFYLLVVEFQYSQTSLCVSLAKQWPPLTGVGESKAESIINYTYSVLLSMLHNLFNLLIESSNVTVLLGWSLVQLHSLHSGVVPVT